MQQLDFEFAGCRFCRRGDKADNSQKPPRMPECSEARDEPGSYGQLGLGNSGASCAWLVGYTDTRLPFCHWNR